MGFLLRECLLLYRLEQKGMTQAEFARKMKVSRQYVHKLIAGERTMSLEFALNAAYILECKTTDLYIVEFVSNRNG